MTSLVRAGELIADDIMKPPLIVRPADTLHDAADALRSGENGAAAVVANDRLVGLISERDISSAVADGDLDADRDRVDDVMSYEIVTTTADATVGELVEAMADGGVRHLPVVQNGACVGMVSAIDVLAVERDVHRNVPTATVSFRDEHGFSHDLLAAFIRDDAGVHIVLSDARPRTQILLGCAEAKVEIHHGVASPRSNERFVARVEAGGPPDKETGDAFRQIYGAPMAGIVGRVITLVPTRLETVYSPTGFDAVDDPRTGLEVLSEVACHRYLEQARIGRIAVATRGLIDVLPVTYGIVGGELVFRTVPGRKLDAIVESPSVTFEVDDLDAEAAAGWSVIVRGSARLITDADELAQARAAEVTPWAPHVPDNWVAIDPWKITGRRIRPETTNP